MEEIWKNIEGTDGKYQVSNKGRVKRLPITKKVYNFMKGEYVTVTYNERLFVQTLDKAGYLRVHLPRCNNIPTLVHRLVAQTFLEIPDELKQYEGTQNLQINHKDECKTNNFVENLEWCTAKYNSNYGTRNERMGQKLKGRRPSDNTINASVEKCRRKVSKYTLDGELIETYPSLAEAARQTMGVYHTNITKCCQGILKSTGGFKWKYAD